MAAAPNFGVFNVPYLTHPCSMSPALDCLDCISGSPIPSGFQEVPHNAKTRLREENEGKWYVPREQSPFGVLCGWSGPCLSQGRSLSSEPVRTVTLSLSPVAPPF